ncbi:hypothetical protein AVEN_268897-1 [Araneus ventricosus]|uniref:Uncharacterized protein n=1 Tax=Araneus ventricosus TaxID=182803 RepID=A0A4Y2WXV1_ARAVE|nr:hypothetical protein AVEN_268897-1 [Araneus ventricosus]
MVQELVALLGLSSSTKKNKVPVWLSAWEWRWNPLGSSAWLAEESVIVHVQQKLITGTGKLVACRPSHILDLKAADDKWNRHQPIKF